MQSERAIKRLSGRQPSARTSSSSSSSKRKVLLRFPFYSLMTWHLPVASCDHRTWVVIWSLQFLITPL